MKKKNLSMEKKIGIIILIVVLILIAVFGVLKLFSTPAMQSYQPLVTNKDANGDSYKVDKKQIKFQLSI